MNKILKFKSILTLFIIAAVTFSCSSDDNEDIQGPSTETTFDLKVTNTNAGNTAERDLKITTAELNSKVKVNVTFTSEKSMRRLYIAQSINGETNIPFIFDSQEVDEKKDGSVDLVGDDKKTFTFNIDFNTPTTADGTITYILWTTTGRGDFRDISKRNAIGDFDFGTITIKAGNGAVGDGLKSYTQTILNAPLGDGSSSTFMSIFDGEIYKINEGEELASLWDFGYYYGNTNKASLASANNYPTDIINVPAIGGVTADELNKVYFELSSKTVAEFDAITTKSDLDFIVQSTSQRINNLAVGNVIDFVDNYGNKGMIKIIEIVSGTGTSGKITFDIKVQTKDITLKL
ncbi:hypothetical protein [Aquimarina muelleri]|uniref:Uncharacterized protein n=1 Tax=Aquimarina muelleri TaxID=279356 RepID=A0A918N3M2_9FLAO|nr:hypothetical protein [Aquimarina muelleri]MCX2762959.1 hypothetical protein [Aquimarina muelleri]GGX15009.1 hypothetical protein GCM10007384_15870 [Aquimarina muelleri]